MNAGGRANVINNMHELFGIRYSYVIFGVRFFLLDRSFVVFMTLQCSNIIWHSFENSHVCGFSWCFFSFSYSIYVLTLPLSFALSACFVMFIRYSMPLYATQFRHTTVHLMVLSNIVLKLKRNSTKANITWIEFEQEFDICNVCVQ